MTRRELTRSERDSLTYGPSATEFETDQKTVPQIESQNTTNIITIPVLTHVLDHVVT